MNKRSLQLKHIEVFSAVIRSGSMTGASGLLGITQPGVSKIINQTEALCDFSLFERPHGRLIPTPRALRLFDEAERMFVGMEDISRLVERIRQDEPQQAFIATVPLFAQELLPQVASQSLSTNNTILAITARDGSNVLALVVARRADIGIISAVRRIPGVRSSTIAKCRARCAIPEGHSLSVKTTLTAKDFHGQPYVALSRHEGIQTLIDRVFAREGVKPREVVECPLSLGAIAMACAGVG
jgi:DNA-binding transcriptional LysR family regulator